MVSEIKMPKKGYKQTKEHREKVIEIRKDPEFKKRVGKIISEARKGNINAINAAKKLWKDSDFREKTSKAISEARKGNINVINAAKKSQKKLWEDLEYREKQGEAMSKARKGNINAINAAKKLWKDPIYREKVTKAMLKGLMKRPTSFEKKISELCIENSLPFIYTGDGRFLINFKNPDFTDYQNKVVIEVFYSYWKIKNYGSVENYKEYCRKKYNPKGWSVIFIDENEVCSYNWKELCLNKIETYRK